MTQVPMRDGEIHADALEFATAIRSYDLPVRPAGHVVLTNARADDWTTPEVHSLDELLDATSGAIPEPVRAALEAAQRIDFDRERRRARTIIRGASAAAASTCAVPLPVADSAALFPVQMSMLAGISAGLVVGVDPQACELEVGVGHDGGHAVDADRSGGPAENTDGHGGGVLSFCVR